MSAFGRVTQLFSNRQNKMQPVSTGGQAFTVEQYQTTVLSSIRDRLHMGVDKALRQAGVVYRRPLPEAYITHRYIGQAVRLRTTAHLKQAMALTNEVSLAAGFGDGRKSPAIDAIIYGPYVVYQYSLPKEIKPLGIGYPVPLWSNVYLDNDAFLEAGPVVGCTPGGKLISFEFTEAAPHAQVVGTTGSGKTCLIKSIVFQLIIQNPVEKMGIAIIDPKGDDFLEFEEEEHLLWKIGHTEDEIASIIQHVHTEFKRRETLSLRNERRWVLVIDEADREHVLRGSKENRDRVLDIGNTGRAFGINLIIGTHTPDAASIGDVRKTLTNRFLGMTSDARASGGIEGGLSLHKLAGAGDFYHTTPGEQLRFQVALVPGYWYNRLIKSDTVPLVFNNHIDSQYFVDLEPQPAHRPKIEVDPIHEAEYIYWLLRGHPLTSAEAREKLGLKQTAHKRTEKRAMEVIARLKELGQIDIFDDKPASSALAE